MNKDNIPDLSHLQFASQGHSSTFRICDLLTQHLYFHKELFARGTRFLLKNCIYFHECNEYRQDYAVSFSTSEKRGRKWASPNIRGKVNETYHSLKSLNKNLVLSK